MNLMIRKICLIALAAILVAGCTRSETASGEKKPKVAYVTNAVASFWVIAESGVKKVEKNSMLMLKS